MTTTIHERLAALRPAPQLAKDERDALLEVILAADRTCSSPMAARPARPAPQPHRGVSLRRRKLVAFALASAAAAVVPLALTVTGPASTRPDAYAAAAVNFVDNSPRLLVDARGWRVVDLNQYKTNEGDMSFGSASRRLIVDWQHPANGFAAVHDEIRRPTAVTVDGHRGWVGAVKSATSRGYFEARWTAREFGVRVSGRAPNLDAFLAIVHTIRQVPVAELLAALPKDVVTPTGRQVTVTRMLADIPQPPGFDPAFLDHSALLLNRYQIGARLTLRVSCGWLRSWLNGSHAARAKAAAAMTSSHRWAILQEMIAKGDLPRDIWLGADVMNGASLGNHQTPGVSTASQLKNWLCG
jgi:hypothetical protein